MILEKLFGSQERVKILRLFLLNRNSIFESADVVRRSKVAKNKATRELSILKGIGFIKQKSAYLEKSNKKGVSKKVRIKGWQINLSFPFLTPLERLLFNAELFKDGDLIKRFRNAGKLKLIITSGIFINEEGSRADLLIVGDYIKKPVLDNIVKTIESEIGRELNYGVFETEDFIYRLSVCDKFVRDVLDYTHRKIYNRMKEFEEFQ